MKTKLTLICLLLICYLANTNGQSFTPKHKVVFEDQTASACGFGIYCPRGIVYIDLFTRSAYIDSAEIISVHATEGDLPKDSMEYTYYWNSCFYGTHVNATAWPQILTDRKVASDPDSIFFFYNQHSGDFGVADISVDLNYNSGSRTVTVTANTHFAVDVLPADAHYALSLVLTEDSVHSTDTTYSQRNIYTANSLGKMKGAGINFATEPDPVPASMMYYMHVARKIVGPFSGEAGSLPNTLYADSSYSYTFPDYVIPANYHANKMRAIVLLVETKTGEVRNANGANLPGSTTGMQRIVNGISSFNIFPNPFNNQTSLAFTLAAEENASLCVTNMLGQTVSEYNTGMLSAGEHTIIMNGSNFAPGIYFVTLKTNHGSLTKKVVVSR